jgi:hypothetical protein
MTEVVSWHLPEWNEENQEEHQSGWLMTWPRYETGICYDSCLSEWLLDDLRSFV